MSIHKVPIHRRVRQTSSESPEHWLERLRRLKRDPHLLEQLGPVPLSGRHNTAESPQSWQALKHGSKRDPRLLPRFGAFYRHLAALPRRARRWLERKAVMTLTTAALLLALSDTPVAHAAGITVDNNCSLIDAITAANTDTAVGGCAAGSGADIISLPANSTITLTSVNNGDNGLPQITSAITIEGNGATIARQSGAPAFRIFDVLSSGNLTLNNTTVSGGGIKNASGTVTLTNSTVGGNSSARHGGGIFHRSGGSDTLTLTNSTVSGNTAADGGGISNWEGTLMLNNSTVSGNSAGTGGGIWNNLFGQVTLSHSLVSGNTAGSGSELYNRLYTYYNQSGTVVSNNFNLFGHDGNAGTTNFTPSGSDIVPSQPLAAILAPLANNGGATQTQALERIPNQDTG